MSLKYEYPKPHAQVTNLLLDKEDLSAINIIDLSVRSGFRIQDSGFRVQGSGCRVRGSGFRFCCTWA